MGKLNERQILVGKSVTRVIWNLEELFRHQVPLAAVVGNQIFTKLLKFHTIRGFGPIAWKSVSELDYFNHYESLPNLHLRCVPEILIVISAAAGLTLAQMFLNSSSCVSVHDLFALLTFSLQGYLSVFLYKICL